MSVIVSNLIKSNDYVSNCSGKNDIQDISLIRRIMFKEKCLKVNSSAQADLFFYEKFIYQMGELHIKSA